VKLAVFLAHEFPGDDIVMDQPFSVRSHRHELWSHSVILRGICS
jgi:hypothetical protein